MKYLWPIFALSTLCIESAPTPCPDHESVPAITPEPTDAPCHEEEQAPAPTPTSEPTEPETTISCGEDEIPVECDGTDGWNPISVEGVAGTFCVHEDLCVSDNAFGNCPHPTSGLPHGSVCGRVSSGVYGCIPASPGTYECGSEDPEATPTPETPAPTPTEDGEWVLECDEEEIATVSPTPEPTSYVIDTTDEPETTISCGEEEVPAECDGTDGWYPISVEGVVGTFCVQEDQCVADNASGNCPLPTIGLPHGSVCDLVRSGVFGCIPASPGTYACGSDDPEETPTPEDDHECDEEEATVSPTPEPTSYVTDEPGYTTDEPETIISCGEEEVPAECDGTDGWYPISVEGVAGIFCVQQDLCVADNASGNCPLPTSGLPHGSVCGLVRTGVYGCKPAAPGTYACDSDPTEETTISDENPSYYNTIPSEELDAEDEEATYSTYANPSSVSASSSGIPAGAVVGIGVVGALVVIALLAAGYRRHQAQNAEDMIETPVGDHNI